jgi:D-beta-D-heptose 7-phosphate kinase / D-beta-D-heptose 1-phosphate adenosyltransferase
MNPLSVRSKNIMVFGDIMLDVKLSGSIHKLANEAPIPVLLQETEKKYLGGCGNVLMNLQALGCDKLFIFSKAGNDFYGKELSTILSRYREIVPHIYKDDSYRTIVKTRGFANKKIIFRYDIENSKELLQNHIEDMKANLIHIFEENKIDSIIFSDYNKGFLVKELTQFVIQLANQHRIPTFVDPKGDYTKYIGCTLIKPNTKEIQDVFDVSYSPENLESIHKSIKDKVGCKETLLTLSEEGMSFLAENDELINEKTIESEVNDVTGAGDVVLSIIAYYYSCIPKRRLIQLATYMGTISVRYVGTYVLKKSDILKAYKLINNNKLITVEDIKYLKNPIVFTNGCFDILHEGHMALLQFCNSIKPHGGEVMVAINSDDSIKALKGPTRPINDEHARIAILNNIESVDWIIVFREETPYEVLEQIRPHTLVKGGDYTVESIIGKEFCENVKVFTYMNGKSSTNIINKIKAFQ